MYLISMGFQDKKMKFLRLKLGGNDGLIAELSDGWLVLIYALNSLTITKPSNHQFLTPAMPL